MDREQAPTEGWCSALAACAAALLAACSAGVPDRPAAAVPTNDVPVIQGVSASAFFEQRCSPCHGSQRGGAVGPALLPATLVLPDAAYVDTLTKGRGLMPSWSSVLTMDEIAALVTWLKSPPAESERSVTLLDAPPNVLVPGVEPGVAAPFRWTLTNPGPQPVQVSAIRSSGIFSLEALPATVPPGQQVTLRLEVIPKWDATPGETVEVPATVVLRGNGDAVEEVPLTATVGIVAPAVTLPEVVIELGQTAVRLAVYGDLLFVGYVEGRIDVMHFDGLQNLSTVERIDTIAETPNHGRDGSPAPTVHGRLIGGMAAGHDGTLYVTHCDPRMNEEGSGRHDGGEADLNSGMVTALRQESGTYNASGSRHDLVKGMPRNVENHLPLGTALGPDGWLYVAVPSMTDVGVTNAKKPDPETGLSGSILRIALDAPDDRYPIVLAEPGLQFGGLDRLKEGLIEMFASGLRNGFGLAFHRGELYVTDQSSDGGPSPSPLETGGPPPLSAYHSPDHLHRVLRGDFLGQPNAPRGLRVIDDGTRYETPVPSPGYAPPVYYFGVHSPGNGIASYPDTGDPRLAGALLVAKFYRAGGIHALFFEGGDVVRAEVLVVDHVLTDVAVGPQGQIVFADLRHTLHIAHPDVKLELAARPPEARPVGPGGDEVQNGRFDHAAVAGAPSAAPGAAFWALDMDGGAEASATVEPGPVGNLLKVDVRNGGPKTWSVQLTQLTPLLTGHHYRLRLLARSDRPRTIDVSLQGGDARGWAPYSEPKTLRLDDTLQEFGSEFVMRQALDLEARLNLKLGASSAGSVWIGDVRLIDESAQ